MLALLRIRKLAEIARTPRYRGAFFRARVAPAIELAPLLHFQARTVLDVGANRGQFSLLARERWPKAEIEAFEPVTAAVRRFRRVFHDDPLIRLHTHALGKECETRLIQVPQADDGSSFIVDFGGHPRSESVLIRPLDALGLTICRPALMKIDVQGFELEVLRGAENTLSSSIDYLVVECTFRPMRGIPPAETVIAFLTERGFRLTAVLADGPDGDLLFERA